MSSKSQRVATTLLSTSTLLLTTLAQAQAASSDLAPAQPAQAQAVRAQPAQAEPIQARPAPAVSVAAPAPSSVSPPPAAARVDDAPQVLFQSGNGLRLSGYGGVDVAYTRMAGKDAVLLCGGGALLIERAFSIGLIGCGVPTRISGAAYGNVAHESGDRLELGYGGLVAGYYFFPKKLYNLSLSAMVGGGAASIVNRTDSAWNGDGDNDHVKKVDPVFVAEPRLTGYINLTRWARAGAFIGYRFAAGVDMRNLSSADLSGPVAGGSLQFGWF